MIVTGIILEKCRSIDQFDVPHAIINLSYTSTANYIIINPSARSVTSYYSLAGNSCHVFPFVIDQGKQSLIEIERSYRGMEDGALKIWLSTVPLDQQLFVRQNQFNPYSVSRKSLKIAIWDNVFTIVPKNALSLNSMNTYFLNVKNTQAQTTGYKLNLPNP